jgi:hypothetical protein
VNAIAKNLKMKDLLKDSKCKKGSIKIVLHYELFRYSESAGDFFFAYGRPVQQSHPDGLFTARAMTTAAASQANNIQRIITHFLLHF